MDFGSACAYVGAGLAVGISAIGTAIGEGKAAREAARGVARQPARSAELIKTMLLGQAMSETPGVFGLLIALLLVFGAGSVLNWAQAVALLAAGLATGIGAFGSGQGCGWIAAEAVAGEAANPGEARQMTFTMFVAQALAQTPLIFALVVSLVLWLLDFGYEAAETFAERLVLSGKFIGASVSVGAGALGPAWGTAMAGASAVANVARYPETSAAVTRTMLIGMGVSQTTSIYSLFVAVLLLFVV